MECIEKRLEVGRERYGHGVRSWDTTTTWGTQTDSWLEMAKEEFLDGAIYLITDYIRRYNLSHQNGDDNDLILEMCKNTQNIRDIETRSRVNLLLSFSNKI